MEPDYYDILKNSIEKHRAISGKERRSVYLSYRRTLGEELDKRYDPQLSAGYFANESIKVERAIRRIEAELIHNTLNSGASLPRTIDSANATSPSKHEKSFESTYNTHSTRSKNEETGCSTYNSVLTQKSVYSYNITENEIGRSEFRSTRQLKAQLTSYDEHIIWNKNGRLANTTGAEQQAADHTTQSALGIRELHEAILKLIHKESEQKTHDLQGDHWDDSRTDNRHILDHVKKGNNHVKVAELCTKTSVSRRTYMLIASLVLMPAMLLGCAILYLSDPVLTNADKNNTDRPHLGPKSTNQDTSKAFLRQLSNNMLNGQKLAIQFNNQLQMRKKKAKDENAKLIKSTTYNERSVSTNGKNNHQVVLEAQKPEINTANEHNRPVIAEKTNSTTSELDLSSSATEAGNKPYVQQIKPKATSYNNRVTLMEYEKNKAARTNEYNGFVTWNTDGIIKEFDVFATTTALGSINMIDGNLALKMSLRRNTEDTMFARHVIELRFTHTPKFHGKSIVNAPGLLIKQTAHGEGTHLAGVIAKISKGFFWIALSTNKAEQKHNQELIKSGEWWTIPVIYETGTRAIITIPVSEASRKAITQSFADQDL